MNLSREFIQYQIDNPHNLAFKSIIPYEDREDTIDFKVEKTTGNHGEELEGCIHWGEAKQDYKSY